MRKNKTVVLGAAALCVGMLGFAGCNNQVMDQRDYVPETVDAGQPPMTAPVRPYAPIPLAPVQPVATKQAPVYQPMPPMAAVPVTSSVGTGTTVAGATHVIKSGDTVGKIARQYGVSSSAIMQANNLDEAGTRRLQIGRKLTIPGATAKVNSGAKSVAMATGTKAATNSKAVVGTDGTYTVEPGDFPGKIARKLGVKEADLMKANNLTAESAKRLQVGQKLAVPGKGAKVTPAVAPVPTPAKVTPVVEKDPLLDNLLKNDPVVKPADPVVAPTDIVVDEPAQLDINQVPVILDSDTTLAEFAAKHNVSAEKIKELNAGMIPADGKLSKDLILMVPGN